MNYSIGAFLKEQRKKLGISQSKVAKKLAISTSLYNHYENEKRTPSLEAIIKLSNMYNTNPMDIICLILSKEEKNADLIYYNVNHKRIFITNNEQELLEHYNSLLPSEQKLVIQMVNSLSDHTL